MNKILLALLLSFCGCKPQSGPAGQYHTRLVGTSSNTWDCVLASGPHVKVSALCFAVSTNTDAVFKERREFRAEKIDFLTKRAATARTKELAASYRAELADVVNGMDMYNASWPQWPMVMVFRQLLEGTKPTTAAAVCRSGKKPVEVVFLISTPGEASDLELVQIVTDMANHFQTMPESDWVQIPMSNGIIFNDTGNMTNGALYSSPDHSVFLRQK